MASPGDKKYLDKRSTEIDHLYLSAASKRSFRLQSFVLRLRRWILSLSRTQVVGAENIPQGACILASSHTSYFDPFWVGMAKGRAPLRFVTKSQLFRFPFVRLLLALGAFPIKRGSSDAQAFEVALEALTQDQCVILFPQGGIHKNLHPDTARWGAGYLVQRATCPVVPARVFYGSGGRTIVFGEAELYEQKSSPTREDNLQVARDMLSSIEKIKQAESDS